MLATRLTFHPADDDQDLSSAPISFECPRGLGQAKLEAQARAAAKLLTSLNQAMGDATFRRLIIFNYRPKDDNGST